MSKTRAKTGRASREESASSRPRDEQPCERPAIVPHPPPKRPVLLALSIVLLAGWIVFLVVLAYVLSPAS